MDSILILGNQDEKLIKLLSKMGYGLLRPSAEQQLAQVIQDHVVDLIIIDSQLEQEWVDLCSFFRAEDSTAACPIVCLASDSKKIAELHERQIENVELVDVPYNPASVLSKIAVQLRLRKNKGKDSANARLGEINAALRDLNDRFSRQIQEAEQLQNSLLPQSLPADARFEIAAAYCPLDGVGGDWYDVRKEPSGAISFQVADVTGHGLSAAFICSMTKLARSAVREEKPHLLLKEMNRLIAPVLPGGKFITIVSVLYDPQTGMASFARGGHPPALVIRRAEKKVHTVQCDGFALGFLDDAEYALEQVQLELNDLFLIFTDGLNEAQNMDSELYGFARMGQSLLNVSPQASAAEALQAVFDDFETFRGGRILKDDVTAIVIKRVA